MSFPGKQRKGLIPKERPRKPGQWDWYTQVNIGGKWPMVSLCLPATDARGREANVRVAEARRDAIKSKVLAGKLSSVLDWVKPKQVASISLKLTLATMGHAREMPRTWEVARDAWLATFQANRAKPDEAKINPICQADDKRISYVNEFIEYVNERGLDLEGVDITRAFISFSFYESCRSSKGGTTIGVHYSYLAPFAEYLAGKGLCQKPDREAIKKSLPPPKPVRVVIPHWRDDLRVMRALRDHRHDTPGAWSAWAVFLLVRGIGRRPDEPLHLSWSTVNWIEETVEFLDTKENKTKTRGSRHVPILFAWVREGMLELKADLERRQPESSAVCLTRMGRHWASQVGSTNAFADWMDSLVLPSDYRVKKAQKCHIEQLRSMRVPDVEIAEMTGHSLATYLKHYAKQKDYRRTDRHDYEEFGTLSENGVYWLRQWSGNGIDITSTTHPASKSLPTDQMTSAE